MVAPLATQYDVETALLRPLTDTENNYIGPLIAQASALLRTVAPSVDDRIARFAVSAKDLSAVSPETVTVVVAGIVKRYMVNPRGITSTSETTGPYGSSESYVLRGEKEIRGELQVTTSDLGKLFPMRKRLRAGTIRTRAALAPRPVGRYGQIPTPGGALDAVMTYSADPVVAAITLDSLMFTQDPLMGS